MKIVTPKNGVLLIGRAGENETTQVQINVAEWETLGDGTYTLLHQRATDSAAYPVEVEHADHLIKWTVASGDTAVPGYGKAQLVLTIGSKVAKSVIYDTITGEALSNTATPPDPWQSWVDSVTAAKDAAEEAESGAEEAKEDAETAKTEAEAARDEILAINPIGRDGETEFTLGLDANGFYVKEAE